MCFFVSRTREPEYINEYGYGKKVQKSPTFLKVQKMILILNVYKTDAGQFAMSHGSYDSNLGSEILILGGDIRSRSWPNIGDSYGI